MKPSKYSGNLRLWHWLNVLAIAGSLLTVLLNSTLFEGREESSRMADEITRSGVNISPQQAGEVRHALDEKVWDLHVYAGYFLIALLIYRIVSELLEKSDAKLSMKVKQAFHFYQVQKDGKTARDLFVKSAYMLFYVMLGFMAVSGLIIKFHRKIGISNSISHSIKEVHGAVMYMILAFIVIHIAGVFLAEKGERKGIVSDMINGGNAGE